MGSILVLTDPARTLEGSESMTFQYNPETITRTRTGEWTKKRESTGRAVRSETGDTDVSAGQTQQARGRASGMRGGGLYAKSETIAFKLVFDCTELALRQIGVGRGSGPAPIDVLPELAFLERIALGGDKAMDKKSRSLRRGTTRGRDGTPRPIVSSAPFEVLVQLGRRRFPAVLTNLTITEKRFNTDFNPTLAECDLKFRVLEAGEVYGSNAIQSAFSHLLDQRETASRQAIDSSENSPANTLGGGGSS